ncbi:MAG: TolC family protein [Bacteroidales bacterium]|nr:TolC family protein [Bacteroidales bacterium]
MRYLYRIFLFALLSAPLPAAAQPITLDQAVERARTQSVAALQARQSFISTYWAWRSYQASRLPSLTLYGDIMNYDRSLNLLQSYEDGSMHYVSTQYLHNSIGLRMRQNIPATGGTLTLYSDLTRTDQFGRFKGLTWYTQPVSLAYTQPIFAYNAFKWAKRIEPKEYEKGRRQYLEAMEKLTQTAVERYFSLLLAQVNSENARTNCRNTQAMAAVARERMRLGSVSRDEYLQLELRLLNDSLSVAENDVAVREARMALNTILGLDERAEVEPVWEDRLPDIWIDYEMVLRKAHDNGVFPLDNELEILQSEAAVAKAKSERGLSVGLNARFGLSKTDPLLDETFRHPLDQEVVGLSFSIPIFDWGLGKGRVQKARAALELSRAKVLQAENDFRREVFTAVGQFNNQGRQCGVSRRAKEIAQERYELTMERFRNGNASVTDLNTARSENDTAIRQYVSDISAYWRYYYSLRKIALYDFLGNEDIDVDFMEMVK